jgi:hypothetical protein
MTVHTGVRVFLSNVMCQKLLLNSSDITTGAHGSGHIVGDVRDVYITFMASTVNSVANKEREVMCKDRGLFYYYCR